VHYGGRIGRYNCYGARTNHGAARCISISGLSIDAAISTEVLRVLRPLGIQAALKAIEAQSSTTTAAERQLELSLQHARYEAAHARRQYDAVDPANRLVAGELERRWNEALQAVARIEGELAALIARRSPPLGEPERQQLMALGADLERAWSHPVATAATAYPSRGTHGDRRAQGRRNHPLGPAPERWRSYRAACEAAPECGRPVQSTHSRQHDRARVATAKLIGVCNMTALRMLRRGDIKGRQACAGAPWVIKAEDLAGFASGKRRKPPLTQNATQQVFDFQ
jgi:hypothetical protein